MVLATGVGAEASSSRPTRSQLTPQLFAHMSSGVGLIKTFNCSGVLLGQGTGFLVGTSVLMTARHVIVGACRVRVFIDGEWVVDDGWSYWHDPGKSDDSSADIATIKLHSNVPGYLFKIKTSSARIGENLAAVGHPLGNYMSLNQGPVVDKRHYRGMPVLAVRLLAGEGGSGSPLVDDHGNVVGILQLGFGSKDVFGQRTAGVVVGIDLPSWWPTARSDLCHTYPKRGIFGCAALLAGQGGGGAGGGDPLARCRHSSGAPDCAGEDLTGLDLSGHDYSNGNFKGANLQEANFYQDVLQGANFENAQARDVGLGGADLEKTIWTGANLQGANLRGAILSGATFKNANLQRAELTDATIVDVDFTGADLKGAGGVTIAELKKNTLCHTVLPDGTTTGC